MRGVLIPPALRPLAMAANCRPDAVRSPTKSITGLPLGSYSGWPVTGLGGFGSAADGALRPTRLAKSLVESALLSSVATKFCRFCATRLAATSSVSRTTLLPGSPSKTLAGSDSACWICAPKPPWSSAAAPSIPRQLAALPRRQRLNPVAALVLQAPQAPWPGA